MDFCFKTVNEADFKHEIEKVILNCFNTGNTNPAQEELKTLLLRTKCDSNEIERILCDKGFEKERTLHFINLVENRKSELLYLSLIDYNSKFGEAVSDFDWSVKLVNGTSELKNLKYPLLQLALTTTKNSNESQKTFDISSDMLNKLIDVLENIK